MTDRVYMTVASFCLVEAIEKLKEDGCIELGLSKQDGHWLLSFNLPCKKMPAANDDELLPEESRAPCSPQMIAEADCEGDKAKYGDVCHAKH